MLRAWSRGRRPRRAAPARAGQPPDLRPGAGAHGRRQFARASPGRHVDAEDSARRRWSRACSRPGESREGSSRRRARRRHGSGSAANATTSPRTVWSPRNGEKPKNTPSANAAAVRRGVSCVWRSCSSQRRRRRGIDGGIAADSEMDESAGQRFRTAVDVHDQPRDRRSARRSASSARPRRLLLDVREASVRRFGTANSSS